MTYLRAFSIFTGRHPLQHAEAAVEVGDVVEPHRVADIRDLFVFGTEQLIAAFHKPWPTPVTVMKRKPMSQL